MERQQVTILDLILLSVRVMSHLRFFFRCFALLERRLLPWAANSARYCSSGSTPTNGRPDICIADCGNLIVRRKSCTLCGVSAWESTGANAEKGGGSDGIELDAGIREGAVAARER